ncbi:hypothetical protein ACFFSW_30730 [Saccharothrix longispora]|uniref:Fe-S cluster assembly iron-binding protein IscA n=1 Tax=Saccharothrix longispora TaxID=33920 RepID=A0ABU1PVH4_9PSEU|nr:hypothetical protein [Saccharothrix longispora]MDR6594298.1 hypothetical protein [Saccharothrix longispora]
MLNITHAAGAVIGDLSRAADGGGGLRIGWSDRDGVQALTLAVTAHPVAREEVVTAPSGGRVFLAPDAAHYLRDKLLDVRMDVDGCFRFSINDR